MSNEKIANIYLSASGKGQEVDGNTLLIKDVVRLYPTLCTVYSNTTAKFGFVSPLNGKSIEHIPTPEGFPFISSEKYSNYYYYRSCLRKGYIYIYIERYEGKGFFKEYEVSDEGFLTNLIWLTKDEWRNPKRDKNVRYISVNRKIHKNIWLVYSPLRWSMDYANDLLNDENKRNKRMQKLVCENCFSGNFGENGFSVKDASSQIMVTSFSSNDDNSSAKPNSSAKSFDDWYDEKTKAYYERQFNMHELNYALKKNDENNCDFYFMLYDPQGVADALCVDKGIEMERLNNMVESIKSIDKTKTTNSISTNEESELSALVDLGVVIYRMLNEKAGLFKKYKDHVSEKLIKDILLVDERKKQHQKIKNITYALAEVLKSEAYQLSCQDYIVDDQEVNQDGKSHFCKHLNLLVLPSDAIDGYIDNSILEIESISKIDNNIATCVNTILSKDSNSGVLIRLPWDLDSIVAVSLSLTTKAASSLEDMVHSLLQIGNYLKDNDKAKILLEALNFKSKDGQQYIKLPESKIPDELKKNIDLSKLKTTTVKNQGKGYLIKLDDVTYNNSSLSDTLLKYRSKNVVITLETIMPKWKEQLLNVGKKTGNWIKGFNDFINKPSFLRAMSGVAFINLTLTIKTNENNLIKYFDVLGTITYLFTLNQKAVEKFAPKFAGTIISKAVFSKATTVFFVASAIVDAITLYNKNQTTAGLFALISGLTAFIGAISIISSGPIGWILIFISISTSIIVELMRFVDLQSLLENCAYGISRKIEAKTAIELLNKVMKVCESDGKLEQYIHNQQYTLNYLSFIIPGSITAKIKMLYDCKSRYSHPTTILESTKLRSIEIEFNILCASLLNSEIDISIATLDYKGTVIKYLEINNECIINVDAINGSISFSYNNNLYDTSDTFKGCKKLKLKLLIRPKEKIIASKFSIIRSANAVVFYFPYLNKVEWSTVSQRTAGVNTSSNSSRPFITREINGVSYSPDVEEINIEPF